MNSSLVFANIIQAGMGFCNNDIYLIGDVSKITTSSSSYYAIIADKATCVVQDPACDIASQFMDETSIAALNKYGFESKSSIISIDPSA